jgi:hypothetical protein
MSLPLPLSIGHWGADDDEGAAEIPAAKAPVADAPEPGGKLLMLRGGQMGAADQAREVAAHAFRVARMRFREARKRPGGLIHGLLAAKPRSVQEQCDYAKGRAWVPAGHDGGRVEGAGVVFHAVVGRPGTAIGNLISGITGSPLCFCLAVGIPSFMALVTLVALKLYTIAALIGGAEALMVAAWLAAGEIWVRVNNLRIQRGQPKSR